MLDYVMRRHSRWNVKDNENEYVKKKGYASWIME
jgi:hypothetical protein